MKILIVGQCYYPDSFRINEISRELVSEGHEVTVLTGLPDYTTGKIPKEFKGLKKRRETLEGVHVIRVPIVARRFGMFWRVLNYGSFMLTSTCYAAFCKKKDFDVIFCYQTSPVTMANAAVKMQKRSGSPLFLYCLDLWPESLKAWNIKENSLFFRMVHKYSKWVYSRCDCIGITSLSFREYLAGVDGVMKEKMVYLPQHADSLPMNGQPHIPKAGEEIRFAFGGNIGSVQDVECIVRTAALLKDMANIKFEIYGDGSELLNCKALAEKLKVEASVCFHGRLPAEEMYKEYRLVDAFLLTLKEEGYIGTTMPAKLQEYMSAGKPIFAAISGSAAQVIRESASGFVVAPSDSKALAQEIRRFAQAPESFLEYGKNARMYFEQNFTKDKFMSHLSGIFQDLMKREC